MSDLHRVTVDGVGRLYSDGSERYPSVSTVLSMLPTPSALKRWKKRTENPEEVKRYKQNRGTLIHYDCQQSIMPRHPFTGEPVEEMWGGDEQNSEDDLKEYGNWERVQHDRQWAEETWNLIRRVGSFDEVIDLETFVVNREVGYAGQFDMLYQDKSTNETVLGDIKTGKHVYDKNLLQLTAYKKAVPISIDRMEIIRLNPDRADWEISSSHDWLESEDELWEQFCDLRQKLEEEQLANIEDQIDDELEGESDDVLVEGT